MGVKENKVIVQEISMSLVENGLLHKKTLALLLEYHGESTNSGANSELAEMIYSLHEDINNLDEEFNSISGHVDDEPELSLATSWYDDLQGSVKSLSSYVRTSADKISEITQYLDDNKLNG